MKRKIASLLGLGTAAGLLMVAGATQANAVSANVSSWNSSSACNLASPYQFCLYYHQYDGGGMWGSTSVAVSTITASFPYGEGAVRNNAASAEDGTYCAVGIWVSPYYSGNSDFLSPDMGGNLGPALRNNEASIAIDDPTNCHGIGIG